MIAATSQLLHLFDLGHQGDVDRTVLAKLQTMTPTERLQHHEGWRCLLKRSSDMSNFLEEMVIRLTQAQVEFLIVGGVSAVLQGANVVTQDLDLCYRRTPENIARLAAALTPMQPRPQGFPHGLPFVLDERTLQLGSNFTLEIGNEAIDLLGDMSAIGGYEQVITRAEELKVAGCLVKVLPLDLLILTKQAAGRAKDLAVLPELRAALEQKRKGLSG